MLINTVHVMKPYFNMWCFIRLVSPSWLDLASLEDCRTPNLSNMGAQGHLSLMYTVSSALMGLCSHWPCSCFLCNKWFYTRQNLSLRAAESLGGCDFILHVEREQYVNRLPTAVIFQLLYYSMSLIYQSCSSWVCGAEVQSGWISTECL